MRKKCGVDIMQVLPIQSQKPGRVNKIVYTERKFMSVSQKECFQPDDDGSDKKRDCSKVKMITPQ